MSRSHSKAKRGEARQNPHLSTDSLKFRFFHFLFSDFSHENILTECGIYDRIMLLCRAHDQPAMGCRQAVRHGTLTPASVGSNPAIPDQKEGSSRSPLFDLKWSLTRTDASLPHTRAFPLPHRGLPPRAIARGFSNSGHRSSLITKTPSLPQRGSSNRICRLVALRAF